MALGHYISKIQALLLVQQVAHLILGACWEAGWSPGAGAIGTYTCQQQIELMSGGATEGRFRIQALAGCTVVASSSYVTYTVPGIYTLVETLTWPSGADTIRIAEEGHKPISTPGPGSISVHCDANSFLVVN